MVFVGGVWHAHGECGGGVHVENTRVGVAYEITNASTGRRGWSLFVC